jgi:hypothetical protein
MKQSLIVSITALILLFLSNVSNVEAKSGVTQIATINTKYILEFTEIESKHIINEIVCSRDPQLCENNKIVKVVPPFFYEELKKKNKEIAAVVLLYNQIKNHSENIYINKELKINKSGKVLEGVLEVGNSKETLTIGNDKISIPPNSTLIFSIEGINIKLKDNAEIKELPTFSNLGLFNNTFELSGKNIKLPFGAILQEGTLSYSAGNWFVKKGTFATLENIKIDSKTRDVNLYYDGLKHTGNYISLGPDHLFASGDGFSLEFKEGNPYVNIAKTNSFIITPLNQGTISLSNKDKQKFAPTLVVTGPRTSKLWAKIINGNSEMLISNEGGVLFNADYDLSSTYSRIPAEVYILDEDNSNLLYGPGGPFKITMNKDEIGYSTTNAILDKGGGLICPSAEQTPITGESIGEKIKEWCKINIVKKIDFWYSHFAMGHNAIFDRKFNDDPNNRAYATIIDKTKLDKMYKLLNTRKFKRMSYPEQLNYIFKTAAQIAKDKEEYLKLVSIFASNYKHLQSQQLFDSKTGRLINVSKYKALVPKGPEQDKIYHMLIAAGMRMHYTGPLSGFLLNRFHEIAELGSSITGSYVKTEGGKTIVRRNVFDWKDVEADHMGTKFAEKLAENFDETIAKFDIRNYIPTIEKPLSERLEEIVLPKRGYYNLGDGKLDAGNQYRSIKLIQELVGMPPEDQDGIYGPKTMAAVKKWQEEQYSKTGFCAGKYLEKTKECIGDGLFGAKSLELAKMIYLNKPLT